MPAGSLFGTGGPAPLRRPTLQVSFGGDGGGGGGLAGAAVALGFGGGDDAWARAVVRVMVESVLAPAVGFAEVVYAPINGEPAVAVGDEGTIDAGYADGGAGRLFTGTVRAVTRDGRQAARLVAVDGASQLARLRVDRSFEQMKSDEVIAALCGDAGVTTGTLAAGAELPFVAIDGARGAWSHVATLARYAGHWAYVAPDGALHVVPVAEGEPAAAFTWGDDILAIQRTSESAAFGEVTMWGEGAAGGQGADAWATLLNDSSPVTGTAGSGLARRFGARALRSGAAAQAAADGIAALAARLADHGELLVPGAPAVHAGSTIEVDAPDTGFDGRYLVTAVRHTYDKRHGYRSRIRFIGGGGGAPGLPGGF
jgi:hypothetical protein